MLPRFTPRMFAQVRQQFLRPSIFPHRPLFFSTTARQFSASPTEPGSPITAAPSNPSETNPEDTEQEPTPTNLNSHPDSISCTVAPPPTYAFLKPTPVVLLTGPFGGNWCYRDTWQATLADQGYQSTSIEFTMPLNKLESGDAYIRHFTNVLKTSIETDHSFYPPILIAHGLHALVAQKYVESNPVSAMVLVSPFIPEIIKGRFSELSRKLQQQQQQSVLEQTKKEESHVKEAGTTSVKETTTATTTETQDSNFETHSDVLAQKGFRETFVLPKKAVYKIDQVAKEIQEKEKSEEKGHKEKAMLQTKEEEAELKKHQHQHEGSTLETDKPNADTSSSASSSTSTETSEAQKSEALGTDSVPIWGTSAEGAPSVGGPTDDGSQEDGLPEMTVESEASIPSPLEQLPLAIYDSIPTSLFEPNFPILLITSNADEIVSTKDVKEHHVLSGQVDHIELEDLDDGGHLIMVSDNAEWEQSIRGITEWLDSNGM
ncbi:hypothetical protein BGX27_007715 [Mortierella sp. AM989]|nr:hypothetical protein BGX27_007715 [Mortierella sp. AM989]